MTDDTQQHAASNPDQRERYSHGYGEASDHMARKSAQVSAFYLIPHLIPGMSLLDCGCGPGTITVGLAEAVAPGQVVGVDIAESEIERAKAYAAELEVSNVRFQVDSIYELPFPNSSFDVVHGNTVLQHLAEPDAALNEMHRVLKSGGVIGIGEEDWGTMITYPDIPLVKEAYDLYMRYWEHNGGRPYFPRRYKEMLRKAGFTNTEMTAFVNVKATPEDARQWGQQFAGLFLEPVFMDYVIELGLADREKIEQMSEACENWGEHPDAFFSLTLFQALAWKE